MRKLVSLIVVLAAITCTDREPTAADPQGPVAQISDAAHSAGNAHFFLLPLPPLVRGDPGDSLLVASASRQ